MANVYIEARPKGLPTGAAWRNTLSRITPIMCCKLSRRSARPSTGHTDRVIIHSSLAFGI